MTDEIKHENGTVYPQHFVESESLDTDILRHLCPYVFSRNEYGRRNNLVRKLIKYHDSLTGNDLSDDFEQIASCAKTGIFPEKNQLFENIEGYGNYKYIGDSYGDGYVISEEPVEDEVEEKGYVSQQHLEAKDNGRELLYVWWHNDSEELAKLKDRTKWAMKVGKHNSPNVGNRFSSYTVAVPHNIRLGLTVSCAKSYRLEKAVHSVLNNRGLQINEEGSEWYLTNIDEVLEILRFHYLID